MSDYESTRGILTEEDRAYLRGETDYAYAANERKARSRIRSRIRTALQDFALIHQYLELRDLHQIQNMFAERDDETHARASGEELLEGPEEVVWDYLLDPEIVHYAISTGGMRSTQAFLASLLLDLCEEFELSEEQFEGLFEELAERGLCDAYGKLDQVVDVSVNVEVRQRDVDPETLRAKFEEAPDEMTEEEIEWLIHLREFSWDEYDGYLDDFYRSAGRD